ncbi:MAG: hypothetical protein A2Z99_15625 [Treponema sp. GWB1_62_6]|nr:MAG: hypothetical protein A2Z99_15625 [Treponema sp. GWB1_62_6]OHE65532.1 MAG: hypothetical protein A2001_10415 [Treponema sp. GWC1_61_84]OHE72673.1 MAG: hypothetical protein A2413_12280 [Treponema sp. RIFOXYC1_FULL_61_9]
MENIPTYLVPVFLIIHNQFLDLFRQLVPLPFAFFTTILTFLAFFTSCHYRLYCICRGAQFMSRYMGYYSCLSR